MISSMHVLHISTTQHDTTIPISQFIHPRQLSIPRVVQWMASKFHKRQEHVLSLSFPSLVVVHVAVIAAVHLYRGWLLRHHRLTWRHVASTWKTQKLWTVVLYEYSRSPNSNDNILYILLPNYIHFFISRYQLQSFLKTMCIYHSA